MSALELTDAARETYERLFGRAPQPDARDPELLTMLQNEIFGEVFSTGVLDDKLRELVRVFLQHLSKKARNY